MENRQFTAMETAEAKHPARIQVSSSKKPLNFYVNLTKRLMAEHGESQLSALGQAISTMVTVVEILKKEGWVEEKSITTYLDAFTDDGRERQIQKPKMEVVLTKSPQFDALMAEHLAAAASGHMEELMLEQDPEPDLDHDPDHDDQDQE